MNESFTKFWSISLLNIEDAIFWEKGKTKKNPIIIKIELKKTKIVKFKILKFSIEVRKKIP